MSHPAPEKIKAMLIYETPTPVQQVVDFYTALLEENKKLQQKLKDYEGCKGVEDYYSVLCALRDTREELEHQKRISQANKQDEEAFKLLQDELEQVKAERDQQRERGDAWMSDFQSYSRKLESLRTELSAKDKVLEWYADNINYMHNEDDIIPVEKDDGSKARSILSQYKGEDTHDHRKTPT